MKGIWLAVLILSNAASLAQSDGAGDASFQLFRRREAADIIKLERDADALLAENSRDVCALLVKARVLTRRGRLAEALRESRLAVESARKNPRPEVESEPRWTTLSLYELSESLRLVDKTEEQLSVLADYLATGGADDEKRNDIRYPAGRRQAEALIKLGRLFQAQAVIDAELASPKLSSSARAGWLYTKAVLISFENAESGEPVDLLTQIAESGGKGDQGILYVRGQLHQARKEFSAARADYLASFNAHPDILSAAFPGRQLALLDLLAGSWLESIEWAGRAWDSLRGKSPALRQDLEKDMRCTAAQIGVGLGYPDLALQILGNLPAEPPRFGGSLQNKSQWECWAGVSRWLAIRAGADFNRGTASHAAGATWQSVSKQLSADAECALISEDVLHHLSAIGDAPLQPVDSLSCTAGDPVMFLSLVRMLGPSVARGMLQRWPLRTCPAGLQALIEAEIAWRSGYLAQADALAAKAIEGLGPEQRILQARAMMIRGIASHNPDWLAKAWQTHPACFLLAGERIPVKSDMPRSLAPELEGLAYTDSRSLIKLVVNLEQVPPTAEFSVSEETSLRVELDPKQPVLAIKRLLLCPLKGGLTPALVSSLTGQSRSKPKVSAPGR